MKKNLILLASIALASQMSYADIHKFNLLPDLEGHEYSKLLNTHKIAKNDVELNYILDFGKRNLEWLDHINKFRTDKKMLFSYFLKNNEKSVFLKN